MLPLLVTAEAVSTGRVVRSSEIIERAKPATMRAQLAMFDFGWGELMLIGIVALVAIGPKELPGALRTLGQWVAKVRRMATDFQNQFHEAMREAELAELKKEVDEMAVKAESYTHFDPIDEIRKDIETAAGPAPALDAPPSTPQEPATGQSSSSVETSPGSASAPIPPSSPTPTQGVAEAPAAAADDAKPAPDAIASANPHEKVEPEPGRPA
jgi:sec-independent protein translocase protein TatB